MTKKVTRQQIAGSQGEAFVKERANAMGFLYSPYGPPEAGYDGLLELRDPDTGAPSGRLIAVQVKTTDDGDYTADDGKSFQYLMDTEDVAYWREGNLPVIVVLVHLGRREAFWKSVDTGQGQGERRLHVTRSSDSFAETARDALAALCVAKSGFGVWFPTYKGGERAHMNLLEVVLPEEIYVGATPFKTGRDALFALLDKDERPPDDWTIRSGHFTSFRDPRGTVLDRIVDGGSIEVVAASDVVFPDDEADEHAVIDLLRRTLTAQLDGLLAFNRDQKAFYFPAAEKTIEKKYAYTSLKIPTSADVVKKYEKDGRLKFVRHHAFEPRFWRVGDAWFLSVSPTFVFTWDGVRPDRFAGGRLAGKKQREFNSSLLGQFVMWRHLLTGLGQKSATASLFDLEPERDHILQFGAVETLALPRGVPDDVWRSSEVVPFEDVGQGRLGL
ncbi:MAG: DUF4365 domain-containing protein [Hyphomonadaceae bacterium]|nr:DUF4365 domain-containing protein [Hyphomonadaceae bacterium]